MLHSLWNLIVFRPIYNALIALTSLPGHNIGLSVILLTILVKLILFPISRKAIISQLKLKKLEPELARIRKTISDKQEQAKQTLALYKSQSINPFSSFFLILIQLPVIIALYLSLSKVLNPDPSLLYPFIHYPGFISTSLFGIFNLSARSIVFALLAGLAQFIQIQITAPKPAKKDPDSKASFNEDFANTLNLQMRYGMPLIIVFIAYRLASIVALYWAVSSLVTIVQELFVRRRYSKQNKI